MSGRLALGLLLLAACRGPADSGRIEGTVTWQGEGVPAALVEVYRRPERDPTTSPVAEAASGEDGKFQLEAAPGNYWIWARATLSRAARETRLVGEATANPVAVAAGRSVAVQIPLQDPTGFQAAAGPEGTGVLGSVEGAAPAEVMVYAYAGSVERPTGPGFAAAVAPDPKGSFRLHLPPGVYTIAARWRSSRKDFGALQEGDRVATAPAVEVHPGAYRDVGTLTLRLLDPRLREQGGAMNQQGRTGVSGRIVGTNGSPVAGVHVLAFSDSRMAGKPLALSGASAVDGAFRLDLPGGGTYYLGARSRLGGPAEPGEQVGSYRGEGGSGVRLAEGEQVEAVVITVEEVW